MNIITIESICVRYATQSRQLTAANDDIDDDEKRI